VRYLGHLNLMFLTCQSARVAPYTSGSSKQQNRLNWIALHRKPRSNRLISSG